MYKKKKSVHVNPAGGIVSERTHTTNVKFVPNWHMHFFGCSISMQNVINALIPRVHTSVEALCTYDYLSNEYVKTLIGAVLSARLMKMQLIDEPTKKLASTQQ